MADRAKIIDFLRAELALGPMRVSELEKRARVAGLLQSHQTVSGAKAFKKAKQALGVQSIRDGFGPGGEWSWVLPSAPKDAGNQPIAQRQPAGLAVDSAMVSRCEEHLAPRLPIPADPQPSPLHGYELRIAHLRRQPQPSCVPRHQWDLFTTTCERFFDPRAGWHDRASALGWTAQDLFACHSTRPLGYLQTAGLLWRSLGGHVKALHKDWALLEVNGAERVVHKRQFGPNVAMPWDLR